MAHGAIKFIEGANVSTRDGRVGIVKSIMSERTGKRGRPPVRIVVQNSEGEWTYGLSELKAI